VTADKLDTASILLANVQKTTGFFTGSATAVQVTGLTATVTIPAGGRAIEIEAYCGSVSSDSGGSNTLVSIWDGVVGSGTLLTEYNVGGSGVAILDNAGVYAKAVVTPSAGSKTYNVGIKTSSGTVTMNNAATRPGFLLIKVL
jgi:hypothetical protein